MEKPKLEKIIEKLEKLDIHEWVYEQSGGGKRFVTRTKGLTFHLYRFKDVISDYYLEITNEDGSKEISYNSKNKSEKGGVKKFYETIRKKHDSLNEEEFKEKLDCWLSEQGVDKPPMGRVIEKLEKLDIREWGYTKDYYGPHFTARINGLIMCLFIRRINFGTKYYRLIVSNEEGDKMHTFEGHKKGSFEADEIKRLYEKICKEHDTLKEEEFGERLDNFLSE